MPDLPPLAARRRRAAALLAAAAVLAPLVGCSGDEGAGSGQPTATTAPEPTTTTTAAPLEAGETIYVYVPEVGDCFDRRTLSPEEGGERIVLLLDCALPHEAEVFAVVEIDPATVPTTTTTSSTTTTPPPTAGDDDGDEDEAGSTTTSSSTTVPAAVDGRWPGEEALERLAKRVCPARFDDWAGIAYERSSLEIGWILPTESSWASGDRRLACTVYDPGGTAEQPARLSGSMAGAGR